MSAVGADVTATDHDVEATRHLRALARRAAAPLVAVAACALSVCTMGVGARDDDYITYWAAEQLADHGRLVNINGVRLEQSSSLAHVVLLALLYAVTKAPLPVLGYLVGMVGLALTVYGAARLAARVDPRAELPTAVVTGLAFPLLFWATGGLETLLAAASVLWFVSSLHRVLTDDPLRRRTIASFLGSAALVVSVRPDTMLVAIAVVVLVALAHLARGRSEAVARWVPALRPRGVAIGAAGVLGAAALLAGFRLVVFHRLLPQPELAKAGGLSWFSVGFSYVFTSLPPWMWAVMVVLLVAGGVRAVRERSVPGLLALGTFVVGCVALMFTRGDWMGGARLLVPYLAPGLATMVLGARSLGRWARHGAVLALVVVECVSFVYFVDGARWLSSSYTGLRANPNLVIAADVGSPFGGAVRTSRNVTAPPTPWYTSWDFVHERDAIFLAGATPKLRAILDAAHGPSRVTIASYQAGMVMFTWQNEFPGRLRFIDMDGLVTDDFSGCPGLVASFAGNVISYPVWVRDAGHCAPPLPDLLFFTVDPQVVPGLLTTYRVVERVSVGYRRNGLLRPARLLNVEFLAIRRGWLPTAVERAIAQGAAPRGS